MYEIGIMNPRRKKHRKTRRKARAKSNPKRSHMARRRNAKGRFVKARSNPRRKRRHNPHRARRAHSRKRRVATVVVKANPRRRRRSNPHRRHHYRARRRNPSMAGLVGGIVPMLQEGAVEGLGALGNSVLLGYALPYLPATLTTGYALDAVRIVSATLFATLAKKFGGRYGALAGRGAIAVSMYHLFKDITVNVAPTLPLGDYEEIALYGADTGNIAGYMDPATTMGAYMNGRRLPDGSRGMGAYMQGYRGDMEQTDTMAGTDY